MLTQGQGLDAKDALLFRCLMIRNQAILNSISQLPTKLSGRVREALLRTNLDYHTDTTIREVRKLYNELGLDNDMETSDLNG